MKEDGEDWEYHHQMTRNLFLALSSSETRLNPVGHERKKGPQNKEKKKKKKNLHF